MSINIEAIRAFSDNYIWAVHDNQYCVLVDPGEAPGALEFLRRGNLRLAGLLLTHHHPDHTGGVDAIRAQHPAPAWGPPDPRMPARITEVREGERIEIPELRLNFDVLETPGHTTSHIAFHGRGLLFCGDTLFSVGCGRLFEGNPEQMLRSLDKLGQLPPDTAVYCGHEYTADNCSFALKVDPENPALQARSSQVRELRRDDRITLPSSIGDEKACNPFMRTREPAVVRAAADREPGHADTPEAVFGVIRRWKDAA